MLPTKPSGDIIPPSKPSPNTTLPPIPAGAAQTYSVTNPTTNAKLYVQVFAPQDTSKKYPALVLVPGGTGDSKAFTDDAMQMASVGIVAITFDPDGRGKSTGQEDYNGHKQQDGLAAVVRFAATLSNVDAQKIGVATYSYGITMGSGALARHSDLPVKFLIDWEGPADRNYTSGCQPADGRGDKIKWQPCSDNAWWSEREAVNFIGTLRVRVPYLRIQSEKDHVQPNNAHAVDMINAAIKGGVPWVRLNDYPPNQTYDPKSPPQMFPEQMDRQLAQTVIRYARELFGK
jgi:dipeptidyl aminopeptidase/acylaminoacyl peptidase